MLVAGRRGLGYFELMPDCLGCGAPIEWVQVNGENVKLDLHDAQAGQERRLLIEGVIVKVDADSKLPGPVVHECLRTSL